MHPRQMESGNNMFLVVSVVIFAVTLLLAGGVFIYARILNAQSAAKEAALQAAEQAVSETTVDSFLRLRDRLSQSETLLNQHVMVSQFFDALESVTLANVRFTSLSLAMNQDHTASVHLAGTAKTFNALAQQSAAFATQPLIKQAIFSGISADAKGVVSFSVSAALDPKLVILPATVPSSWSGMPTEVVSTTTATTTP
jgi:hypothetical protein